MEYLFTRFTRMMMRSAMVAGHGYRGLGIDS
jgi:hypothetical protein